MLPFCDLQQHPRTRQKYIKKGRIHSEKALLAREQKWLENWSSLLEYKLDELESSDDGEPSEHNYSVAPAAVQGFTKASCEKSLKMYCMLQEVTHYYLEEEDLTTDEEDEVENLTPKDDGPLTIEAKFSAEQLYEFGYCEETANPLEQPVECALTAFPSPSLHYVSPSDISDEYNTDGFDSESGRSRPISRISLGLPYCHSEDDYDNSSHSGSESDVYSRSASRMSLGRNSSYYESEDEPHSIKKKRRCDAIYGHIPGVLVGKKWKLRRQCSRCFVHRPLRAGIHGGPEGAYSIVLSSTVYVVKDKGGVFKYKTKKIELDEEMARSNLALAHNIQTRNPVRVVRGFQLQNKYSPSDGYRYDGLYEVTQSTELYKEVGFKEIMFDFARCPNQPPPPWSDDRIEVPYSGAKFCQHSYASSDDGSPPKLQIPESIPERSILYPNPPHLHPGFYINPTSIEVQHRPVVVIERLHKKLLSELLANPQKTVHLSKMPGKIGNNDELPMKRKRGRPRKTINQKKE